jgi:hypothetical protein
MKGLWCSRCNDTKPLVRLILNQIARRLTEALQPANNNIPARRLLLMLDFFESSLAFLAGYRVRTFRVAQSLNQIDKTYEANPDPPRCRPVASRSCRASLGRIHERGLRLLYPATFASPSCRAATSGMSWRATFSRRLSNMVFLLRRLLQLEGSD